MLQEIHHSRTGEGFLKYQQVRMNIPGSIMNLLGDEETVCRWVDSLRILRIDVNIGSQLAISSLPSVLLDMERESTSSGLRVMVQWGAGGRRILIAARARAPAFLAHDTSRLWGTRNLKRARTRSGLEGVIALATSTIANEGGRVAVVTSARALKHEYHS
jgi:hypothetical protein